MSGKSQRTVSRESGVHYTRLCGILSSRVKPYPEELERIERAIRSPLVLAS
jgi:hypothetical protein